MEGAVGGVEELELLDGALRHRVEGGATPAPLHQADGLGCGHKARKKVEVLHRRCSGWGALRSWSVGVTAGFLW